MSYSDKLEYDQVISHKDCSDGTASAWIIKQKYPNIEIIFVGHKETFPIEKIHGRVIFTDFCPSYSTLVKLDSQVESIIILDHHPVKIENKDETQAQAIERYKTHSKVRTFINDPERAGCQITWDFIMGTTGNRPWFIDYIADRDRWVWLLPDSKAINQGLYKSGMLSLKGLDLLYNEIQYSLDKMDFIFDKQFDNLTLYERNQERIELSDKYHKEREIFVNSVRDKYKTIGEFHLEQQSSFITDAVNKAYPAKFLLKKDYRTSTEGDICYRIKVTDCPGYMLSEVGNELSKQEGVDFALTYWYDFKLDVWNFRLRGNDKVNLSELAQCFPGYNVISDGGGHPNAAGFGIWVKNPKPAAPHSIHDILVLG